QEGASEVYLDGRLLARFGRVGTTGPTTVSYRPCFRLVPLPVGVPGPHVLAIRYAKFAPWPPEYGGFFVWAGTADQLLVADLGELRLRSLNLISIAALGMLGLLHWFLYLFYRPQRANLYYSLYLAAMVLIGVAAYALAFPEYASNAWGFRGFMVGSWLSMLGLLAFVYFVCCGTVPWLRLRWGAVAGTGLSVAFFVHPFPLAWPALYGLFLAGTLEVLRVLGGAIRRRQPGLWVIGLGVVLSIAVYLFAGSNLANIYWGGHDVAQQLTINLGFLLLPICTSFYLAREFATTRRGLETQLLQVEHLSAQTLALETERRQLVSAQNERLEATVQARTEEISHQNHTLAAQRDEISAQADRLRALDQEKTRFFTNVTHEFRTPLTLILGPAAQIVVDTREPATRQQAQLVERNAQRLLHLINQLLDLSRLEAGQQALCLAPGEAVGFVRGLVGGFESLAGQRGIAYSFEADPPTLTARFDADKLEKVVVNLLSNAFKFTPSAGEVAVGLRVAGAPDAPGWLELTVRDTGRGIAPEQLPHVFDRFYQADASDTRAHEGTGIGLALTKELVELHGGTIALASAPGCGTTATVRLPLLPAAEAAPVPGAGVPTLWPLAAEAGPGAPEPALPGAPERPLVLLIEDNADMREYLRTVLAPDYQLLEAENGEAGVALAGEHLPDLVLTDAMMPLLDGYGVCRALKHNERTSHIPVVLLTAKADLPSRLQGLDTGADAYLTKPFRREELLAQLRNLVRGRQQLQAAYRRALAEAPAPGPPTMEEAFLARVRQAVEQALDDETLDVETLARTLALSRTQLHRKLKALTGQAPGDLIRLVRLTRAHALLASGTATVAEVAYQVGYGNPANFSTSFSRHFGYAPSEIRRRASIVLSEN
uniref:ATP-binding protein n=1 Tax=Hymenobacter terricola TaxID=2819236 RepID=UPI001CF3D476